MTLPRLFLATLFAVVLLAGVTPAQSQANEAHQIPSCDGYPEPRRYLQIHTWWEGDPVPAGEVAHLHAETCFPLGQVVSGLVTLDTKIVLHNNPGRLFRYESALFTNGQGEGNLDVVGLNATCGLGRTCEYWVRTTLDTRGASDGWHEVRVKPRVEFGNGDVQLTSSGWPIFTRNGNPQGGQRQGIAGIVGRGWYTDEGYQNPVLNNAEAAVSMPVRGTWNLGLRLDAGSGGQAPTFSAAYIDPDFHHHDEDSNGGGILLGSWPGGHRGPLAVDTTRLADGEHNLVLRVDAARPHGRLVALQYVPFRVANHSGEQPGHEPAPIPPHPDPDPAPDPHPDPDPDPDPAPDPHPDPDPDPHPDPDADPQPDPDPDPHPPSHPNPGATPPPAGHGLPFNDIAHSPFASDIVWLSQSGITTGCSAQSFCPGGAVTRGQMASFLARALKLPATTRDFFDDDERSIHERDINRLAAAGITGGCGSDNYCPSEAVSREQMAAFLHRADRALGP